jgi:sugar phosphate isomerase/epimerase
MVQINQIGMATDGPANAGLLDQLETELAYYYETGYRLVEVNPLPFHMIVYGQLRRPQLDNYVAVLKNFNLRYSVHGLDRLNLAYDPRHEMCRQIMRCQLEICHAVGASRLVYHSGLQYLAAVYFGVLQSLFTDEELAAGAQREVAALKEIAPIAADKGVIICVENGPPHQLEYNVLTRFGRSHLELAKHQPWLRVEPIIRQLETVNHPNVAMTLDFAHLYISAVTLEFDYLEAVTQAAPWTKHLHVNDNFGQSQDWGFEASGDRVPFGEADLHLPPGWGSIPYREVFARLPAYEGDLILEIKPSFRDYFAEALTNTQEILAEVDQE